jgi:tRNA pseudouridine55 synthase
VNRFEIHGLEEDRCRFTAEVSAGTYVRSLAHELGEKIDIGAHLAELRRTISGEFSLQQAVTLERLADLRDEAASSQRELAAVIGSIAVHPRRVLQQLPSVTVNDETAALISNGRAVNLSEFSSARLIKVFLGQEHLIAVAGRIAGTLFQPKVVLRSGG